MNLMIKIIFLSSFLLMVSSCGKEVLNKKPGDVQILPHATNCNISSGQICGQPPMPPCAPNAFCAQVMPNPVTYENECKMKEVNATFINSGQCL
jgi:hypothetical protein